MHLGFTDDLFHIDVLEFFQDIDFWLLNFLFAFNGLSFRGRRLVENFMSDSLIRLESCSNNKLMVFSSMSKFDNLRLLIVQVVTIFCVIVNIDFRVLKVADVSASCSSVLTDEVS